MSDVYAAVAFETRPIRGGESEIIPDVAIGLQEAPVLLFSESVGMAMP
jgi:hypothetical protein